MVNACIDSLHRKKKFEREEELRMAEQVTQKPSALESINYNELLELVWKLSDAYRTVFNLIAIEGYTHEEVSKLLNISVGTSKSNYARAKQRLQVMLQEYFGVKNGVKSEAERERKKKLS